MIMASCWGFFPYAICWSGAWTSSAASWIHLSSTSPTTDLGDNFLGLLSKTPHHRGHRGTQGDSPPTECTTPARFGLSLQCASPPLFSFYFSGNIRLLAPGSRIADFRLIFATTLPP